MKNSISLLALCGLLFSACKPDKPDSGGTTNPPPPPSSVTVSPGSFMLPARDTIVKVGVAASGAWKFEVASTGTGWITAEKFTTNSKDSLKLTIAANTGTSVRTSKVTVSLSDGTQPKDITLTQTYPGAAPTLELENPVSGSFSFANAADTVLKPVIVTFSSWSAAIVGTASWVMLEKPVGSGKDTLRLTVVPNGTTATRTATVRVTIPGTTLSKDIAISQGVRPVITEPVLTVKEPSYNVTTTTDTTIKVEVKNAVSTWTAAVQGTATWLTATKKTGTLGVDTVLINLPSPNTTPSLRIGTVRVTSGTQTQDVTVTQGIYTWGSCSDCFISINPIPVSGEWLSADKMQFSGASAGTKVLFPGGRNNTTSYKSTDIYDTVIKQWTSNVNLSSEAVNYSLLSINNKVYLTGGYRGSSGTNSDIIEVYDPVINAWSNNPRYALSQAKNNIAIAANNNAIIVAGGILNDKATSSNSADIFLTDGSGTINGFLASNIDIPRAYLAAAGAGDEILFAGGSDANGLNIYNNVSIYNTNTRSWDHSKKLSEARNFLSAVTAGNKIYVAGGYNSVGSSSKIDVYNTSTHSFEPSMNLPVSDGLAEISMASAKNLIFFAGGVTFKGGSELPLSRDLHIYNTLTNQWSKVQLSKARKNLAITVIGNKVFVAGGTDSNGIPTRIVDIFTLY
ncbi:MAG TPA: BACON domain-containing carbohydrate-binding protein [Flavisolibacter sp.]|jgi:N-acetylneuraminic acid mutarotase|nr:BACON domain-containing carbohydrate-binding protein [Flavisolibacter sp.]